MNPKIPKKKNPPIIPKNTKEVGRLVLLETIKGLRILSTEDAIIPKTETPNA